MEKASPHTKPACANARGRASSPVPSTLLARLTHDEKSDAFPWSAEEERGSENLPLELERPLSRAGGSSPEKRVSARLKLMLRF